MAKTELSQLFMAIKNELSYQIRAFICNTIQNLNVYIISRKNALLSPNINIARTCEIFVNKFNLQPTMSDIVNFCH